jgi:outer membrane protein OmpA-like peptidoglycan-associated protein
VQASTSLALALSGVAAALLTPATARAEYPASTAYLGVHGGMNVVLSPWDFGKKAFSTGLKPETGLYGMGGIRFGYQLSPQAALELGGSYLPVTDTHGGSNTGLEYDLDGLYHFTKSDWTPFVLVGVGGYHLVSGDLTSDFDPTFHAGLGLRGLVAPWLALRLEARDILSDGFKAPSNNLEVRAGLDIFLASKPDQDKDGIPDDQDHCPQVPGVASANGCPDRDGDGIGDKVDACPEVPGKAELDGCPDEDGDGISDKDDACPHKPGPALTNGCPDTDGDGVADKDDACPEVAGKPELKGCPDEDGDGITDADDACPKHPGPKSTKGCPDRDNDGVADSEDKCPDVTGLKAYQGCVPEAVKKFTGAIQGITFDTGKATIKPSSFSTLDKAVAVLKQFPELKLAIEGHTDDVADDAFNLKLSQERADSVRSYLLGKGIEASRLRAVGYGETRPKADNKTSSGRALNRRIEFTIVSE